MRAGLETLDGAVVLPEDALATLVYDADGPEGEEVVAEEGEEGFRGARSCLLGLKMRSYSSRNLR